jgi:hypothetical protein
MLNVVSAKRVTAALLKGIGAGATKHFAALMVQQALKNCKQLFEYQHLFLETSAAVFLVVCDPSMNELRAT